jgi:hypothetical protein
MSRFPHPPRLLRVTPLLAMIVLATACDSGDPPDPIVGSWRSTDVIGGDRNELELEDDLAGEAVLHFYYDDDYDDGLYFAEFDVIADPQREGEYALYFECLGNCSDLDFTAKCELRADELDCTGQDDWSNYTMRWEHD